MVSTLKSARKIARLTPENTVFFECDIQQKISHLMFRSQTVIFNAARLT